MITVQTIEHNLTSYVQRAKARLGFGRTPHLGRWLVENAPRGAEIALPSRHDTARNDFDWLGEAEKSRP